MKGQEKRSPVASLFAGHLHSKDELETDDSIDILKKITLLPADWILLNFVLSTYNERSLNDLKMYLLRIDIE